MDGDSAGLPDVEVVAVEGQEAVSRAGDEGNQSGEQ